MSFNNKLKMRLEDICIKITDGSHFSPKENYQGYPMLSVKDMTEYGFDYSSCKRISEEDYKTMLSNDCVPKRNDILVAKDGSYLKHIFVIKEERAEAILSSIAIFRPNTDIVYPSYLCYLLKNPIMKQIIKDNYVSGSALPRIVLKDFKKIEVEIPPLPEQKAIAATLSALDDMIELNNQTNKTLEEMAQAIFKSWFVDFEPFKDGEFEESELGLIPKGWRVGCVGDYVRVKSGFAFKSSWWEDKGIPVIKIKNIDNYTIDFGDVSYVSEDKVGLAKEFIVNGGDLVIAMTGATIGKFAIVPKMQSFALVNQRVGKFFLGDNPVEKLGFIYCILKQDNVYNEIVSRGDGSAQPNISPSGIESIKIVLPPQGLINEYNQLVTNMFNMIIENFAENSLLICLRDILLPKLMSGEIRVPVEDVV